MKAWQVVLKFFGIVGCALTATIYGINAHNSSPDSNSGVKYAPWDLARLYIACRCFAIIALSLNAIYFALPNSHFGTDVFAVKLLQFFFSIALGCGPLVDQLFPVYQEGTIFQAQIYFRLSWVAFGGGILSALMAAGLWGVSKNKRTRNGALTEAKKTEEEK